MEATAKIMSRVVRVQSLARTKPGADVTFSDGSAGTLDADDPNFGILFINAEHGLRRTDYGPVGVITDEGGRIVDLGAANGTSVAWVRESLTDANLLRVAFWAYSPICALTRDHPEFDRIHATLAGAAGTTQRVWVVTHSGDTVEDEFEEGLFSDLPKIMDVRPV